MRFTRLLFSKSTSPSMERTLAERNGLKSMQGLSMASMKRHFGLAPLAVIMSAGMAFVTAYIIRLSTKTTDIQWVRNPDGFNDCYKDKNFRILNMGPLDMNHSTNRLSLRNTKPFDHAELGKVKPEYRE